MRESPPDDGPGTPEDSAVSPPEGGGPGGWAARKLGMVRRLHNRHPLLAAITVMLVLGAMSSIGGLTLWHNELRDLRVQRDASFKSAESRVIDYFSIREFAVDGLADRLAIANGMARDDFAAEAAAVRRRLPDIAAIAWIGAGGTVRRVEPSVTGRGPEAGVIASLPPGVLGDAGGRREARISPPFRLADGGGAVAIVTPIGATGAERGVVLAVLSAEGLARFIRSRGAAHGDDIEISDGTTPLVSSRAPGDAAPTRATRATRHMAVLGRDWTISVVLRHEGLAHAVAVTAIMLALSLGVAVMVGWFLRDRQRLTRNQHEFDLILNNTALRILYKNDKNRILRLNAAAAGFHGLTVEQAIGESGYELFPKYARARHEEDLEVIRSGKPHFGDVKEMGTRNGIKLWGRADKIPYKDPFTGEDRILMVATDVTDQVNAEIALRRSEERYNLAIEMSSIGTWDWDIVKDSRYWSPRMKEILGIVEEAYAPAGAEFENRIHHDDRDRVLAARNDHLENRTPYLAEFRMKHEGGSHVWVRGRGQAVWDEDGRPVRMAGSVEDITERVNLQHRLAFLAHHDALTGLDNRVMFHERLEEAARRARRGESFALLCIDLDGFKKVNDTLGHAAGDQLLKLVGRRIRGCVRETDTLARLGGDEFAVIHSSTELLATASALANRIIESVSAPYDIEGSQSVVGASVGIAASPGDGTDVDRLMNKADLALYCAKQEGRGIYRMFEPEMEASIKFRHALAADLRRAVANGELTLYYQPLVNLEASEVSGFEALLRWNHPERGLVLPGEFIPAAEECGLINQIGEWVLGEACSRAATWPDHLKVAVNISPVQFRGGVLMLTVAQALARSGLAAGRLELEITEAVLLDDDECSLAILNQLHDLGVRISLDDFGTGYSSLSYLQRFPFDKIKIDASFISDIGEDDDIGIVHAIVSLARRLGVATTAEGVETEDQLKIIEAEGCTEMQGHLFSPPRPADEIEAMYARRPRQAAGAAAG